KNKVVRDYINEILPTGHKNIGIIFSGRGISDEEARNRKLEVREMMCIPFTLREAKDYIGDLLDKDQMDSVFHLCKGNPGYLATVRRMLESGIDVGEDFSGLRGALPELFEMEWRKAVSSGDISEKVLA